MIELSLLLGVLLLSWGLRTFDHAWLGKLGAAGFVCSTYLAGWFLTNLHAVGAAAAASWFLLPWVPLLTRVRHLQLPLEKELNECPPPRSDRFPLLGEFSREIEEAGFNQVADVAWECPPLRQFFRVFYRPEDRQQAIICFYEQEPAAFAFVALTSRTRDGRILRTWNCPFSDSLKNQPGLRLRRIPNAASFADLETGHRDLLQQEKVSLEDCVAETPATQIQGIETESDQQVAHNLKLGLLKPGTQPGTFRYSGKGLLYLYRQSIIDMVRLS